MQRALTPTMSLTVPMSATREPTPWVTATATAPTRTKAAIILPGANSITGQTLHYDPSVAGGTIAADGGTNGQLPAALLCSQTAGLLRCQLRNPRHEPLITPGMCGWNNGIAYRGDDQNTEFDALQVTLAQAMKNGLSHERQLRVGQRVRRRVGLLHLEPLHHPWRDSNVRDQQLTTYGSYDFPSARVRSIWPAPTTLKI